MGQLTDLHALRGDLIALRTNGGNFTPTVQTCLANDVTGMTSSGATDPGVAGGFYYLLRPGGAPFCNQLFSYGTGAAKETAGRDGEIRTSTNACP